MACHGELARDRPPPQHLTEFYLILSIGGALGGMFNALLAPLLFRSVAEYPIVLVLACVLCLGRHGARRAARRTAGCWSPAPLFNLLDVLWPAALGILAVGLIYADHTTRLGALPRSMSFLLGALAFLCFTLSGRPLRFGLGLACLLVIIGIDPGTNARHLLQERSFFGVLRVVYDADGDQTELLHGTTEHGAQSRDPARRREPLTYYFSTGPIGQVFAAFGGPAAFKDVALVGLGAGTLACYAEPGQRFTFYEIDPAVRRIALNPSYFTYLPDARQRGADLRIRLGDARLSLSEGPAGEYDLIILDAFGSDSIATHLLTRQALQVYLRRLAPRGIIAFHVSNRYLNLWPVIGDLASDAGLACLGQEDRDVSDADWRLGKRPSEWMLLARRDTDFGILRQNQRWQRVRPRRRARPWTDDYSNILSVLAF
jgi:SAM-dependent methyltransferase